MKKLYEILGQNRIKGDVGIEIEVEGKALTDNVDPRWNATVDGSLRGENREYVLRKPLPVAEVKDVLESLQKNLKEAGSKLSFSFRTSVHVHVNVQDLTFPQYLNFLYAYFLLEEPLMTFCGKERKGNRFCLRLQDAEGMLDIYNKLFTRGEEAFHDIPPNQVRYSAMNIEATMKYGSLEFRGMRGNLEVDVIETWVKALCYLREFAKSVDNPTKVYDLYAEMEAQGFMDHVLKELSPRFYYARVAKDVQRSFSLSIDLPFGYQRTHKEVEAPKAAKPFDMEGIPLGIQRAIKREQERAAARVVMPRKVIMDFAAPLQPVQINREEF